LPRFDNTLEAEKLDFTNLLIYLNS